MPHSSILRHQHFERVIKVSLPNMNTKSFHPDRQQHHKELILEEKHL